MLGMLMPDRVYPRMYGETTMAIRSRPSMKGLSPHVRGNLSCYHHMRLGMGSIPACTGKPHALRPLTRQIEVYPRMYGETLVRQRNPSRPDGLSPHVRGNRLMIFSNQ